jgi:hypothetical protein
MTASAESVYSYEINDMKIDGYLENLQASITPTFSWKIESARRGASQTKYQILVANTEEALQVGNPNLVWDSGLIESDSQIIDYSGSSLNYETSYFWKVLLIDENGDEHFSKACKFRTELNPSTIFEEAKWIGSAETVSETTKYTVEAKMKIVSNSSGLVFSGTDSNNFYLWQFNEAVKPGKVIFRPHKWDNGSVIVMDEIDVSSYMSAGEGFNGWHVIKIVVDGGEMKTYIDNVLVSELTDVLPLSFGSLGIRNVQSGADNQVTLYDYVSLVDDNTGSVVQYEDFSSSDDLQLAFNCGTVNNGVYEVSGNQLSFYSKTLEEGEITWFRKEFSSEIPVRATLSATALGVYELYMNGNRVGEDYLNPGWTDYYLINNGKLDPGTLFYQTYDVTNLIKDGKNAIGAVLGTGWYNGKMSTFGSKIYGEKNYLILKLTLEFSNGKTIIVSDESWKSTNNGPIRYSDLENGEIYDARKELGKWNEVEYNETLWNHVSTEDNAYRGTISKQIGETAKIIDTVPAISVEKHSNGNYIVDLGQEITGWIYLKDVNGTAGNRIRMRFGEMLNADGTVYRDNLRTAKVTDYYTFKGTGNECWRPSFTFRGFRYIEIDGYEGELKPENIIGEVVSADIERTGYFNTSHKKVNKLFENIYWGQIDNFLSIPMGCPQRDERLGWTGDINVFALTSAYNANSLEFLRKYNFDLQMAQGPSGEYTDVAPRAILIGEAAAGWADTGIIIPYICYRQFGDITVAEEFWTNMEKFMTFLDNKYGSGKIGQDKYIRSGLRYGDHLNVDSITAYDLIGTAYFAYDAKVMSEMATALGKADAAEKYDQLFQAIKEAYINKFVTSEGRVYGAGKEPEVYERETQTGYVLSLYMDLIPEELRTKAASYLVENIRAKGTHLTTGFMGISMLMPTLVDCGYADIAYELLLQETYPSWIYSINNGATTIWERWNSWTEEDGFADITMNSFNHYALGSVGEWFYSDIGGISPGKDAGYKDFVIEPQITELLGFAETTYVSNYGRIVSNWKIAKETVTYTISVPANTTATVKLIYKGNYLKITESGNLASEAEGVTLINANDGVVEYKLQSGNYSFVVPYLSESSIELEGKKITSINLVNDILDEYLLQTENEEVIYKMREAAKYIKVDVENATSLAEIDELIDYFRSALDRILAINNSSDDDDKDEPTNPTPPDNGQNPTPPNNEGLSQNILIIIIASIISILIVLLVLFIIIYKKKRGAI